MERREPTLSGGVNEREESTFRRQSPAYDDDTRSSRGSNNSRASSSGPLPAIALTIALLGVAGAGFLGWQLMEAQAMIAKDSARIQQLENQLNVTSSESTQSVTALGINLQKIDTEVKKLWDVSKKTNSDSAEKFASVSKSIDGAKNEINSLKGDTNSLKQDSLAHKASIDDVVPRVDALEKSIGEQRKKVADVATSVNAMLGQVKSAEGLASRITKTEEAIDAIDDNRRSINRDLLQIKQQLGIKN